MKPFYRYHLPFIAYAILIFALSSFEKLPSPKLQFELFDKLIHFCEFFLFSILALRATANWSLASNWKWSRTILISTLISLLYAASDEIHQFFVPGRDCDLYDFVADMAGVITAAIIYYLIKRWRDRQLQKKQST